MLGAIETNGSFRLFRQLYSTRMYQRIQRKAMAWQYAKLDLKSAWHRVLCSQPNLRNWRMSSASSSLTEFVSSWPFLSLPWTELLMPRCQFLLSRRNRWQLICKQLTRIHTWTSLAVYTTLQCVIAWNTAMSSKMSQFISVNETIKPIDFVRTYNITRLFL